MRCLIVIPTYNERENVRNIVSKISYIIKEKKINADILIVDDNSPDGTGVLVEELRKEYKNLFVLHREGKLGLGTAYISGFLYGLNHNFDCVLTMDADLSHNPENIPDLVKLMDDYDLAIGSRYVEGGGTNLSLLRRVLSRGSNTFAKVMLGLKANDCTAGFKCYKRRVLETIDLNKFYSNGYSFLIEMLYKTEKEGFSVGETPIFFDYRKVGVSKISKIEILKGVETVMRFAIHRLFGV